jgi:hypothetical protein
VPGIPEDHPIGIIPRLFVLRSLDKINSFFNPNPNTPNTPPKNQYTSAET